MIPPTALVLLGTAALLALAVVAGILSRSEAATRSTYGGTLAVSLVTTTVALYRLLSEPAAASVMTLPLGLPWLGAHFRLDALAAFFLVVVGLGSAAASLYGLGYGRHEKAPHRVLPFFPAFLAGMTLVVLADDAFTFLLSWEFMSLSSWALVMAHHRDRDSAHAGLVYLVMASFGTLALILAFGLLAGATGSYDFATMRSAEHSELVTGFVLGLVLLGAGSKAGLVPLHVWLPLAHPAAPSHVSALMSGVMTKVAIYGFIRIVFDLVGEPAWWAGMVVLLLGGGTAVLGVLSAFMQNDLKRLLAYSTVENVGIVFIGLGLALAFQANAMDWAAALALTAALLHVFNHALFKSLLFFGAGAVLTATGERDLDRLGGLIHRMPYTSFAFLVGCVSISALPPLNGFVSEWLTFQAILQSPELPQWGLKIMVPAVGAMLALSAALAAACFVKAFGITFLGQPRTAAAEAAGEVDRLSLAAMFILAGLCLFTGVLPGFVIDALAPVTQSLVAGRMPVQSALPWLSLVPIAETQSSYNGLLVFAFIAISASLAVLVIHRWGSHAVRRAPAWDYGWPDPVPAAQYSAAGFAQPVRRVFATHLMNASEAVDMPPPGDPAPARLRVRIHDLAWDYMYEPVIGAVGFAADRLNHLQFLTIRRYLSLVFLALVTLLTLIAVST